MHPFRGLLYRLFVSIAVISDEALGNLGTFIFLDYCGVLRMFKLSIHTVHDIKHIYFIVYLLMDINLR